MLANLLLLVVATFKLCISSTCICNTDHNKERDKSPTTVNKKQGVSVWLDE